MEFDRERASFWLVAFTIGWILVMAMVYLNWCLFMAGGMEATTCPRDNKFAQMLETILASVFAYAAGRASSKNVSAQPQQKEPPNETP